MRLTAYKDVLKRLHIGRFKKHRTSKGAINFFYKKYSFSITLRSILETFKSNIQKLLFTWF